MSKASRSRIDKESSELEISPREREAESSLLNQKLDYKQRYLVSYLQKTEKKLDP